MPVHSEGAAIQGLVGHADGQDGRVLTLAILAL